MGKEDAILIKTNKLCRTFSSGGTQVHVIRNLDITIKEGDYTVIMGSSGSGKSTLLYALSGMDKPTLGEIHCMGEKISDYNNNELALFRRKYCGFVFQQMHLLDNMSALDNLMAGGLLLTRNKKDVLERAKELLRQMNIEEALWSKFPSQLSGGEAQRVAIARALINAPRLIFADEPTGALNRANSQAVLDVMSQLNAQGQSIVMVTHDLKTALRGNRIFYLRDGAVHGELKLKKYNQEPEENRMQGLQEFLEQMGW